MTNWSIYLAKRLMVFSLQGAWSLELSCPQVLLVDELSLSHLNIYDNNMGMT